MNDLIAKPLPYSQDALEPFLSKKAMHFHYDRHYLGYIEKIQKLLGASHRYERTKNLTELVSVSREIGDVEFFHNAAQIFNHEFFWESISPSPTRLRTAPSDDPGLFALVERSFSSWETCRLRFIAISKAHFGSGWTWLVHNPKSKNLELWTGHDTETPVGGPLLPLLTCDLWEHAYYLDYQADREKYLNSFWERINWDRVQTRLDEESY